MTTLNRMRTAYVLTVGIGMSALLAACANEAMPLDGDSDTGGTAGTDSCGCYGSDAAAGSSGQGGQAGSAGSGGTSGSGGNAGSSATGGTGGSSWTCDDIWCPTGYECVQDGTQFECTRNGGSGGSSGSGGAGGSSGSGGSSGGSGGSGGGVSCSDLTCPQGYVCVQDGDSLSCVNSDDGGVPPVDAGNQCVVASPVPCRIGAYGCDGTVFPNNQYCDVPGSNPTITLGCQCPNPNEHSLGTWLPLGVGCSSVNLCWQ